MSKSRSKHLMKEVKRSAVEKLEKIRERSVVLANMVAELRREAEELTEVLVQETDKKVFMELQGKTMLRLQEIDTLLLMSVSNSGISDDDSTSDDDGHAMPPVRLQETGLPPQIPSSEMSFEDGIPSRPGSLFKPTVKHTSPVRPFIKQAPSLDTSSKPSFRPISSTPDCISTQPVNVPVPPAAQSPVRHNSPPSSTSPPRSASPPRAAIPVGISRTGMKYIPPHARTAQTAPNQPTLSSSPVQLVSNTPQAPATIGMSVADLATSSRRDSITSGRSNDSRSGLSVEAPAFIPPPMPRSGTSCSNSSLSYLGVDHVSEIPLPPPVTLTANSQQNAATIPDIVSVKYSTLRRDVLNDSKSTSSEKPPPPSSAQKQPAIVVPNADKTSTVTIEKLDINYGEWFNVVVSDVIHPSLIWIRPATSDLDELAEEMAVYYKQKDAPTTLGQPPDKGVFCAALYSVDQEWYRAVLGAGNEVPDDDDYMVEVHFVDYGNSDYMTWRNLRPLLPQFAKLPRQAIDVALNKVRPIGDKWTQDVTDLLKTICQHKILRACTIGPPIGAWTFVDLQLPDTPGTINSLIVSLNLGQEMDNLNIRTLLDPDYVVTKNVEDYPQAQDALKSLSDDRVTDTTYLASAFLALDHDLPAANGGGDFLPKHDFVSNRSTDVVNGNVDPLRHSAAPVPAPTVRLPTDVHQYQYRAATVPASTVRLPTDVHQYQYSAAPVPASTVRLPTDVHQHQHSAAPVPASTVRLPTDVHQYQYSAAPVPGSTVRLPTDVHQYQYSAAPVPASTVRLPTDVHQHQYSAAPVPTTSVRFPISEVRGTTPDVTIDIATSKVQFSRSDQHATNNVALTGRVHSLITSDAFPLELKPLDAFVASELKKKTVVPEPINLAALSQPASFPEPDPSLMTTEFAAQVTTSSADIRISPVDTRSCSARSNSVTSLSDSARNTSSNVKTSASSHSDHESGRQIGESSDNGDRVEVVLSTHQQAQLELYPVHLRLGSQKTSSLPVRELTVETGYIQFMLAHVNTLGDFYIHLCDNETAKQHELLRDEVKQWSHYLEKEMMKRYINENFVPNKGDIVCAKWPEDKGFYRAVVTDDRISDGETTFCVYFVDYGNSLWMRKEDLFPLSEALLKYEALAIRCSVAHIKPLPNENGDEIWTEKVIQEFENLCEYNDVLYGYIYNTATGPSDERIEEPLNLVILDPEARPESRWINSYMVAKGLALVDQDDLNRTLVDEDTDIIKNWNPMVNDYWSAMNSYSINLDDPEIILSGLKPHENEQICRFYNRAGGCYTGQQCPFQHVAPGESVPPLTRTVWCAEDSEIIRCPELNAWVALKITAICDPGRFYVYLPYGTNIPKTDVTSDAQSRLVDDGYSSPVVEETLEQLQESLNEFYSTSNARDTADLVDFAPCEVVAAQSKNGAWYRAKVLETDEDEIQVFYVDFGNCEKVNEDRIRTIQPQFMHLPFQAIECMLADVKPSEPKGWNKKAREMFRNLTNGHILFAHVVGRNGPGKIEVDLYNTTSSDDIHINHALIQSGFAQRLDATDTHCPDVPPVNAYMKPG